MNYHGALLGLGLLVTGCLKTAEDIRREKMVDNMAQELRQNQDLAAEVTSKMKEVQKRIDQLNGQIEEINYQTKQHQGESQKETKNQLNQLQELVNSLNDNYQQQSKELAQLKIQVSQQDAYIKKVNKTLQSISDAKGKKQGVNEIYQQALGLYEKKKYEQARTLFLQIVDDTKLSEPRRNRVLQSLGLISYRKNDYEEAIVFFSRIYTKWPKSSFAPFALLNIGLSLKELEQKEQAKTSFNELINNYADSKHAKTAKQELSKL